MKKFLSLFGAVILLAAGAFLAPPYLRERFMPGGDGVSGAGTVEATQVELAPKSAGHIGEIRFAPGTRVKAGEELARIDRPDLVAQLAADAAALARARALLSDMEKGPREDEVAASLAKLASAASDHENAKAELARYRSLHAGGAATREMFESYQNAYNAAKSGLDAAEADHRLLLDGFRPDQKEAQRQDVIRAEAIMRVTRTHLDDAVLKSPLDGVVLSKNLERGDYAAAGQSVATIADLMDAWVRIYVPSPQLGLLRLGGEAEITVDAYPGRVFPGRVEEISQQAEFTPRRTLTRHDRANTVYGVKVRIEAGAGEELKPGMPVEVHLR